MKVLITGGAGFIGSTVASACRDAGLPVVILDDLSTGRVEFTSGHDFYGGDIADGALIDRIFADHPDIGVAIHCAARIIVPESVSDPLSYYRNNVSKTVELLDHLIRNRCERLIFSSSASVYASTDDFRVDEATPMAPQSPYARTKMMVELILADTARAHSLRVLSLRYFNPIGADQELRTGLQIKEPTHALGRMLDCWRDGEVFSVTGTDWPTRDGSGLRDYIHVWDLALAHLRGVQIFDQVVPVDDPYQVLNLGTGTGTTVRELVTAFGQAAGPGLQVQEAPRRDGDVAGCYADPGAANERLGWRAELSIEDGIRDAVAWLDRRKDVLGY